MRKKIIVALVILAVLCFIGYRISRRKGFKIDDVIKSRPSSDKYLFNFTSYTDESLEYREQFLALFHKEYDIEMVVVIIPSFYGMRDLEVASEIFTNWRIGRNNNSRGVLLLISFAEMRLKIEVGYGVEDIFTDLFCGYIERKQLKPYFEQNRVGDGLASMIQEFIIRTEGKLTDTELIQKNVDKYLSGGAGIRDGVRIGNYTIKTNLSPKEKEYYKAQLTPELTLARFAHMFKSCIDDPSLGLYTIQSRVYMAYCPAISKPMGEWMYQELTKAHEIVKEGGYAVVLYFDDSKAVPIFMRKSVAGWEVDIVSMVKWVKEEPNADWFLCGNNHPYMFAFKNKPYKDYVYDFDFHDTYSEFSDVDSNYEYYIDKYKVYIAENPDDLDTIIALAKIYFDVALFRKSIKLLRKALKINPDRGIVNHLMGIAMRDYENMTDSAIVYFKKYIEIYPHDDCGWLHISIAYWHKAYKDNSPKYYEEAAKAMQKYAEYSDDKVYCYRKIGYFYFCKKDYGKAKQYYNKVLELVPDDISAKDAIQDIEKKKR